MFPDGVRFSGPTATEALKGLLGGWNPDTLPALKLALVDRLRRFSGIAFGGDPLALSDEDFVRRLESYGMWTVKEVA